MAGCPDGRAACFSRVGATRSGARSGGWLLHLGDMRGTRCPCARVPRCTTTRFF